MQLPHFTGTLRLKDVQKATSGQVENAGWDSVLLPVSPTESLLTLEKFTYVE